MFIGDFEKSVPWLENGVKGCRKFLERVWKLQEILVEGEEYSTQLISKIHKVIKKVSSDFETLKYNTAIADFERKRQQNQQWTTDRKSVV